jgi:lauroyl/myristoyl acyltransferase
LFSGLARLLPRSLSYLIGETLGAACFLLCKSRRRNLISNLEVVLGDARDRSIRRLGLRVMINFGRPAVEAFLIPHMSNQEIKRTVEIIDKERIDRILVSRSGLIVVTAHLGSWELGGCSCQNGP